MNLNTINYRVQNLKCCYNCDSRVWSYYFECYVCHIVSSKEEEHLVNELGICDYYSPNK